MEGQIEVRVRDCTCPGTPHPEGDVVYLAPKLSMRAGMAAAAIAEGTNSIEIANGLADVYLRFGVLGWNLLDDDGRARVFTPAGVEAEFPYGEGGAEISEACDGLYAQDIIRPLRRRLAQVSGRGSTGNSPQETSPKVRSIQSPRKRSSTGSTGRARRSA